MPRLASAHVTAIVFNETRSLSGALISAARINVAHAIINASGSEHQLPRMAPSVAKIGPGESGIFADCAAACARAESNIKAGVDPTGGAQHFNFRKNSSSLLSKGTR